MLFCEICTIFLCRNIANMPFGHFFLIWWLFAFWALLYYVRYVIRVQKYHNMPSGHFFILVVIGGAFWTLFPFCESLTICQNIIICLLVTFYILWICYFCAEISQYAFWSLFSSWWLGAAFCEFLSICHIISQYAFWSLFLFCGVCYFCVHK